ncbi:hypothetical protein ABFS82_04G067900 [Erythranthe guttata]
MASVVTCTREEREDLLPWPIRTRKRGSNSRAMVAADDVELPVNEVGPVLPLEVVNLPLKKRVLAAAATAAAAENENENQFACILCGRAFKSYWAMCGHKAHHTLTEKKKKKRPRLEEEEEAAGPVVVYEPPPPPPPPQKRWIDWGPRRLCDRCGRTFVNGQGLGGHKRYCAVRPQPAPVEIRGGSGGGKVIHQFDLNELPPPEPVEERMALPWHGD